MRFLIALVSFILFTAFQVQADVQAVYSMQDGREIKFSYNEANEVRVDVDKNNFFLMLKEKNLMVIKKPEVKGWVCFDFDKMIEAVKPMVEMPIENPWTDIKVIATGETETIAGYEGKVYKMFLKNDGKQEVHEIVISNNKKIAELTKVINSSWRPIWSPLASEGTGFQKMQEYLESNNVGNTLRYDDLVKLNSLKNIVSPANFYKLPPGTRDLTSTIEKAAEEIKNDQDE